MGRVVWTPDCQVPPACLLTAPPRGGGGSGTPPQASIPHSFTPGLLTGGTANLFLLRAKDRSVPKVNLRPKLRHLHGYSSVSLLHLRLEAQAPGPDGAEKGQVLGGQTFWNLRFLL